MALIDQSYFFGELLIAQKYEVGGSLAMFIDEHEAGLLTDLLGYELKKAYDAGINASTAKYVSIRDGKEYTNRAGYLTKWEGLKFSNGTAKKSLIANYVYWHWMRDQASSTTGGGEKTLNAQNAANASAAAKMVRAWNQMVDWNLQLVEFLLSNQTDYPEFVTWYPRMNASLLKQQNTLGI